MSGSSDQATFQVVVWTAKEHASHLHAALKALGWHYPFAQSQVNNEGEIGFPCLQTEPFSTEELRVLKLKAVEPFTFNLQPIEITGHSVNPHEQLKRSVEAWCAHNATSNHRQTPLELPTKWERLGDLVILPEEAFHSAQWDKILSHVEEAEKTNLWQAVAQSLGGARLARQAQILDNITRSPQLRLLHGDSAWVEFSDYGVQFGFDAEQVMFSSGNVTERHRIGSMDMSGEIIVDAYAGTGYYTLPMLVRSNAAHVHACEVNPASIAGLRWGASANDVEQKLTIHQGNNQDTLPSLKGLADRCHLGLLPSSEAVWAHSLACLKSTGGMLHIHMNVEKEHIEQWRMDTIATLEMMAQEAGRPWNITSVHLERVKSFSPGVVHVVLDVLCSVRVEDGASGNGVIQ
jgi:tRNA wybutosine-synthesizing protein 3